MKFTLPVLALALALAVSPSCRPKPPERTVARIQDRDIRVQQLEAYVASVLQGPAAMDLGEDAPADPARAAELRETTALESDRLRSRLFDALVDEELLLYEADRLGVRVDEGQVRAFATGLHGETPSSDPSQSAPSDSEIEQVRRTLRIQALVQSALPPGEGIDEEEVDALIARDNEATADSGRRLRLRSLVLPSAEVAAELYSEIRAGQLTFDEAAVRQAFSVSQTQAAEVSLDQLPTAVRSAVGRLKSGAVSPPTELHGETYLFQVEGWLTADLAAESEKRMATRAKIAAEHSAEVQRQLLRELRERYEVRVFPENLPFTYVPEDGEARLQ